jgi:hypothetical protein
LSPRIAKPEAGSCFIPTFVLGTCGHCVGCTLLPSKPPDDGAFIKNNLLGESANIKVNWTDGGPAFGKAM